MRKILASDYDGTLYINEDDIERNVRNINSFRNNNIFVIATGRSFSDFVTEIILHGLKYDYLAINHGATILNEHNQVIENFPIEDKIKEEIYIELESSNKVDMFVCKLLNGRASISDSNITKINVKFSSLEDAIKMNNYFNEKYNKYIVSYLLTKDTSIEIISQKINKAIAINKIAQIEKIDVNDVYTIGDSYNDIDMIKQFNGNCMIESKKEVLRLCDNTKRFSSVSDLIEIINK